MFIGSRRLLAAGVVATVCAGSIHAAINIENSTTTTMPFNTTAATPAAFDVTNADLLIVTVGTENKNGGPNTNIVDVQFNGVPMIEAVVSQFIPGEGESGQQGGVEIWYMMDPLSALAGGTTGDIFVNVGGENGGFVSVLALSGTNGIGAVADAQTDGTLGGGSIGLTTTAADSLVISAFHNSGQGNNAGTPTADAPMTQIGNGVWGSQWGSGASGYELVASSGTLTNHPFTSNTSIYDYKLASIEVLAATTGPVQGDFDGDGDVDGVDVATMFSNFNGPGGGVPGNPDTDLDNDGDCDGVDVANLFGLFTGPLAPATVPEPTSLALFGLGGLLVARRRR